MSLEIKIVKNRYIEIFLIWLLHVIYLNHKQLKWNSYYIKSEVLLSKHSKCDSLEALRHNVTLKI